MWRKHVVSLYKYTYFVTITHVKKTSISFEGIVSGDRCKHYSLVYKSAVFDFKV
jgi:hypothetical protein